MLPHQFKKLMEALRAHSRTVEEGFKSQERAIRDTAGESDKNLREIPQIISRSIEKVSDEEWQYEKGQRNKEYRQQFLMLGVAAWTAVFTALAFGAAAYYASTAKGQLDSMIEANKVARSQFESLQRPWLSFSTLIDGPFEKKVGNTNASVHFAVKIANSGNTPAVRANLSTSVIPSNDPSLNGSEIFKRLASMCQGRYIGPGRVYFPGKDNAASEEETGVPPPGRSGVDMYYILVCVTYQSSFDQNSDYHTGQAYILVRTKRDGNAGPFESNEVISVDHLRLVEDGVPVIR